MTSEKKIPTIIGLVILILGIVAGLWLTSRTSSFNTKASGDCAPVNPQITNLTHQSVDISFTTSAGCIANVNLNNQLVSDVRQAILGASTPLSGRTHYFQISGLKINSDYTYQVVSGGQTYQLDSYRFKTTSTPKSAIPSANLAWGKVVRPDSQPAAGSIVYLNLPGSLPLSSLVTSEGNWNISLATSLNSTKTDWFVPQDNLDEEIVVISESHEPTLINHNSSHNNPVPVITLGQNTLQLASLPTPTSSSNKLASHMTTTTPTVVMIKNLEITNPADGESLSTNQPNFFGTGPSGLKISIKVESPETINGQSQVDSTGSWSWTPSSNLSPGQHTITVSVTDPITGILKTIRRQFTVLAASGGPAFSSSSSAAPATPTPTLAPTDTPTPVPTVRSAKVSTSSGMPVSGNPGITFVLLLGSFAALFISLKLINKTSI
jgi:hypothetical protein